MKIRARLLILLSLPLVLAVMFRLSPQPLRLVVNLQEAEWAYQSGFFDLAARRFAEVLTDRPRQMDLWEKAGRAFYMSGELSEAERYFSQAYSAGILTSAGRLQLAEIYAQQDRLDLAAPLWIDLADENQQSSVVYPRLVGLWRAKGDLAKASEAAEKWIRADPDHPQAIYSLALIQFALDQESASANLSRLPELDAEWKARREAFIRASSLAYLSNPQGEYRWLRIGRALASLREWDLAAYCFTQALKLNPNYADALAFLGEAKQNLGKDGLADLQKARQINPESLVVKALFSVYWRRQGQPQVGLVYLQSAAQSEPNQAIWQVELGNTLAEMGDLISALDHFQAAVNMEPETLWYWLKLGDFCADNQIELINIGLKTARQAVSIAPEAPEALDLMGRTLFLTGDSSSAERFLQRALERDPGYIPAHLHLGQLYLKEDHFNLAYEHLIRAARAPDDRSEVRLAKRLLSTYFAGRN